MRFDIFCHVVDNYGDIGVCWRLVKRLAHTHFTSSDHFTSLEKDHFRLFCDYPDLIEKIAGDEGLRETLSHGVEILPWHAADHSITNEIFPDVVIETFSCVLPPNYLSQLKVLSKPLIINVEYLSAEPWTISAHKMPSPPIMIGDALRYFYYPGFTEKSGGLLQGQLPILDESNRHIPRSLEQVWRTLRPPTEAKKVCVFTYGGEKLIQLLNQMQESHLPIDVLICGENALQTSHAWLEEELTKPERREFLRLIPMPFIPQDDFDWLLHACDMNFVRGEDSFVRAQWAGKPFVWDIYPQEDGAHINKLKAFLDIYLQNASPAAKTAALAAMHWEELSHWWPALHSMSQHAIMWRHELIQSQMHGDLAIRLREFILEKIKKG